MSVDRYTKIVLTVIAVCLIWIAFRPLTRAAYAAGAPQVGAAEVNIVAVGGRRIPRLDGLPVNIQNLEVPVAIQNEVPVVIVADYTR